jgi:hypothetical protein
VPHGKGKVDIWQFIILKTTIKLKLVS